MTNSYTKKVFAWRLPTLARWGVKKQQGVGETHKRSYRKVGAPDTEGVYPRSIYLDPSLL